MLDFGLGVTQKPWIRSIVSGVAFIYAAQTGDRWPRSSVSTRPAPYSD
jgi:hypothetical protein